ncbi:MAG: hypothetical protein GX778_01580 [Erysipelothrix sp.]|nr:hypothetical protein [Erysipelothrix sp.]
MKPLTSKIIWRSIILFVIILLVGSPYLFIEGSGVLSGSLTYAGLVVLSCVLSEIHSKD